MMTTGIQKYISCHQDEHFPGNGMNKCYSIIYHLKQTEIKWLNSYFSDVRMIKFEMTIEKFFSGGLIKKTKS